MCGCFILDRSSFNSLKVTSDCSEELFWKRQKTNIIDLRGFMWSTQQLRIEMYVAEQRGNKA